MEVEPERPRRSLDPFASVGYAAKALSARTLVEEPEKAFTVSILHDLGKVLFYFTAISTERFERTPMETGRDLCVLEKETFGIDHQEVGYYISVKWRFPEEFSAGHQETSRDDLTDRIPSSILLELPTGS